MTTATIDAQQLVLNNNIHGAYLEQQNGPGQYVLVSRFGNYLYSYPTNSFTPVKFKVIGRKIGEVGGDYTVRVQVTFQEGNGKGTLYFSKGGNKRRLTGLKESGVMIMFATLVLEKQVEFKEKMNSFVLDSLDREEEKYFTEQSRFLEKAQSNPEYAVESASQMIQITETYRRVIAIKQMMENGYTLLEALKKMQQSLTEDLLENRYRASSTSILRNAVELEKGEAVSKFLRLSLNRWIESLEQE